MAIEIKDDSHIYCYSYIVGRNILNFYLHETVLNLFQKNYDHLSCPPSGKWTDANLSELLRRILIALFM